MSKYRGPRLRIIRSLGKLPGLTTKNPKKKKAPGLNGSAKKIWKKVSKYSRRLKEKQKLRYHYGITERQLLNYMKKARKVKSSPGKMLLYFLEMRLDTIAYRLGFGKTIMAAKQVVNHGHLEVNWRRVNIPSYICRRHDAIAVKLNLPSEKLIRRNIKSHEMLLIPPHLLYNETNLKGSITGLIDEKCLSLLINDLLIVEYYSRKL